MAEPIKEGQYANMWKLKEGWKAGVKGEDRDGLEGKTEMDLEGDEEDEEDFDEDDEDDADLEEVLMS